MAQQAVEKSLKSIRFFIEGENASTHKLIHLAKEVS
jgi:HEPN domain-containing protein